MWLELQLERLDPVLEPVDAELHQLVGWRLGDEFDLVRVELERHPSGAERRRR
ncbi:MAG TPA: hypothetical protein VKR21_04900 [Solirubrobacteraceae bacterium]|nr:hypothetical protein [Solirubrobacteraceae bacterium]